MTSGIRWWDDTCVCPSSGTHVWVTIWWKLRAWQLQEGPGRKSVSVRMLVFHHGWWNSRKSLDYLPFQKVMVKHLKRNLSGKYFVCWWRWFAFLTLLPYLKSIQPMCNKGMETWFLHLNFRNLLWFRWAVSVLEKHQKTAHLCLDECREAKQRLWTEACAFGGGALFWTPYMEPCDD